jgi:hypothetical protein
MILRYLIGKEVEKRGSLRDLPDVRMRHAKPNAV